MCSNRPFEFLTLTMVAAWCALLLGSCGSDDHGQADLRWYAACPPAIPLTLSGCEELLREQHVVVCTNQEEGMDCSDSGEGCTFKDNCNGGLVCSTQAPSVCPVSRRRYKRDIAYLDRAALDDLRRKILATKLATFRYAHEKASAPLHLGFVIEDVEPSPSVDSKAGVVDLYGYISMAVAAIQAQQTQIETLQEELGSLRRALHRAGTGDAQARSPQSACSIEEGRTADAHGDD